MAVEKMAYSIQEASEAIGLHPNTIYGLVESGKLPAITLGRKYSYRSLSYQDGWPDNQIPTVSRGSGELKKRGTELMETEFVFIDKKSSARIALRFLSGKRTSNASMPVRDYCRRNAALRAGNS